MAGTLTRWEPFAELGDLRTRFEGMFDEWLDRGERAWTPPIDVVREDGHVVVRADLPGMRPDEVKIEVEDDILTVIGEHTESAETKERDYVRRERRHGAFRRSLALPAGVDTAKIEATTHDGVVEVRIPLPERSGKETVTITPTTA
jgi:HSP20 family protein